MDTTPRDLDALLAQAGWAKALARSLVCDPDRAEDLVQRAWLAALRTPPDAAIPPRRWLAVVMRNFVHDDAILRWNTCARILNADPALRPESDEPTSDMLE